MIAVIRSMGSDGWYWWLQVGSAGAALLVFAFLTGTILVGRSINKRDAARLVTLEAHLMDAKVLLAAQQERAARAEQSLLELQERTKPRSLTTSQRAALVDALKKSQHKGPVIVSSSTGDGEARDFAKELLRTLKEADWPITQGDVITELVTGFGVHVIVHDMKSPPPHAAALQHALDGVGISSNGSQSPERVAAGDVRLAVTTKPR